jgi:O-antigen ligase
MFIKGDFKFTRNPINIPIAAFLGAVGLSFLTAVDLQGALKEFKVFLRWALLYFVVINNIDDKAQLRRLVKLLVISTTIAACYGIFQHFTSIDLFGHTRFFQAAFARSTGFFANVFDFAAYLGMVLLVCVSLVFFSNSRRERLVMGLASFAIFISLALTHCRGAWLGLLAGLIVVTILSGRKAILALLAGAVLVTGFLVFFSESSITKRAVSIADFNDLSMHERLCAWRSSLMVIKDHPITGVGLHGFQKVYPQYILPQARFPHIRNAHNNFLEMGAGCGILGIGTFIWFLVTLLKRSLAAFQKTEDRYLKALSLGLLGTFIFFIVNGLFRYDLYRLEVMMLFFFFVGVSMVIRNMKEVEDGRDPG